MEGGEHEVVGEGEEEGEEDAGEGQSQRRAQKPQQNLNKSQQNFTACKSKKVHKMLNKTALLVLKTKLRHLFLSWLNGRTTEKYRSTESTKAYFEYSFQGHFGSTH